jgi:phytoene desaturase
MTALLSGPKDRSIAVVGAGVGGLSVAVRLAQAGHRVTLFEKNDGPGGRCGAIREQGYTWDLGPTLLLMPDIIKQIFRDSGRNPDDYLKIVQCDPNYRIQFDGGSSVTFSTDLSRMREELERIEPGSFDGYLRFLSFGRHAFDTSVKSIVSRPLDGPLSYADPQLLKTVLSLKPLQSLHSFLRGYFTDERLLRALSFQTMYLGISPFEAPATFALLPYTELAMGVWYPLGGMSALPRALERLGGELGVTYRYRTPVDRIVAGDGRVEGVSLPDGSVEPFDVVVANADLPYAYEKLIPEAKRPRAKRLTSSAYMLYLGLDRKYDQLEHHNICFGADYRNAFREIFLDLKVPTDPAFYVNVPSRTEPAMAPPGGETVYVLVPVPHQSAHVNWAEAGPALRELVLSRMEERLGMTGLRSHIRVEKHLTPDGWAEQLNLAGGACFGLSHNFMQVGAFRPSTRDRTFKNLYFVGASTQPGTGLPLVMLSAKIVAERFARELDELPRAPRSSSTTETPLARVA